MSEIIKTNETIDQAPILSDMERRYIRSGLGYIALDITGKMIATENEDGDVIVPDDL